MARSAATGPARAGAILALMRDQPLFARQWAGYVASALGDQIGWIALVWLSIRLTGSAATVGGVTFAYIAPQALSAPLVGVVLDRFARARAMAVANTAAGALFAAIALAGAGRGPGAMAVLYPLIVGSGALVPFNSAGRIALVPETVPAGLLSRANFLLQGGGQLAMLAGPAAGGALVAALGAPALLWADAATFLLQALLLRTVAGEGRPTAGAASGVGASLRAGFAYLLSRPALVTLALLEVLFNLLCGPFEVLLPDMAKTLFGGPWAMGLMWTAFGVGAVDAGLVFAARPWRIAPSRSFALIILLWGGVALAMRQVGTLAEACAVMLVGGVIYSPWAALYATVLKRVIPAAFQARVAGAQASLVVLGMPVGALATGLVLWAVPGREVFDLSGLATLTLGCVVLALPALRGLDDASQG